MWCEDQFRRFNDTLKLDAQRWGRIESAFGRLVEFCDNDPELNAAKDLDLFLQGSVSTGSVVKPLAGDEFDVDIVYPFKLSAFPEGTTPNQIMDWFESRFAQSDFYVPRLINKDRCVRVDYAGDFHLDITPATTEAPHRSPWAIATRDSPEWERTDPVGFADWVRGIDGRAGGTDLDGHHRFVRCIRYMKRWRDHFFTNDTAPKSILLVTALGKHDPTIKNYVPALEHSLFPQYETDAAYLYDMLRLTRSCIELGRQTAFLHPTMHDDLSGGWAEDHLTNFLNELDACVSHLSDAIYDQSLASSIGHYKAALGESFPA